MSSIADIRKDYMLQTLSEDDIHTHPMKQFEKWWDQAIESKIEEVNAMTLATVNAAGSPSARIVLLKGFNNDGFTFFTNFNSRKGIEIAENPNVCLVLFWKELERQVRIEGNVKKIHESESDTYFNSRPLSNRIGAWASPQSEEIVSREELEKRFSQIEKDFFDKEISRPPHWGGYIVQPKSIEFWQGRPSRLHDRIEYKVNENNQWSFVRLAP